MERPPDGVFADRRCEDLFDSRLYQRHVLEIVARAQLGQNVEDRGGFAIEQEVLGCSLVIDQACRAQGDGAGIGTEFEA